MNTKRKGGRAEHRAMRILEASGYACTRAAASLGVFDVIAIGAADIRLVQVKCGDRCQVTALEREAMAHFVAPANATKEVWRFFDRRRDPVIERVV
jgi:Holliday junction resolvase